MKDKQQQAAEDEIVTGPFMLVSKRLKNNSLVVLREINRKGHSDDEDDAND